MLYVAKTWPLRIYAEKRFLILKRKAIRKIFESVKNENNVKQKKIRKKIRIRKKYREIGTLFQNLSVTNTIKKKDYNGCL